jgi:hypothetical protein
MEDKHFIHDHIVTLHFMAQSHLPLYNINYFTLYVTCVLHALTLFTTKPTVKPMQSCTHIGNTTTALHLILHPGKCVIIRSHISNDRLLIWTGLVHI